MRILIVSQYFAPELTAPSLRLAPIAAGLAARGHQVEVVCELPNHPVGVIDPAFRGRPVITRREDGYVVRHVWVRASPSKRARARLATYATYAASATLIGALLERPDVVFASSPPLSVGAVGAALAARHRVPLVVDIRDLWPEVAVAVGELAPGTVVGAAERLERWIYRRADAITTPTAPFREHIARTAGDDDKVHLVSNGTSRAWLEAGRSPPQRERAGLPNDAFVWTYAGNLGLSQNLEVAIEAAAMLGEGFTLLLLGDGASRARLEQVAAERGLDRHVVFRSSVPVGQAMTVMRASDALLVSLADSPELGRSVPVKLYDACAIGRPVIVAAPGEPRRIAKAAGAALVIDPDRPQALADAVLALSEDPALRQRLVSAGRLFAQSNLREDTFDDLEELLSRVVQRSVRGSEA